MPKMVLPRSLVRTRSCLNSSGHSHRIRGRGILTKIRIRSRCSQRLKHTPTHPGIFRDLESARAWMKHWGPAQNQKCPHQNWRFRSERGLRRNWQNKWITRQYEQDRYQARYPERFRKPLRAETTTPLTGINLTVLSRHSSSNHYRLTSG